ncbi:MAG TPA: energy transducer TonB [Allosphingosinicella sp.]|jgi:protein TonB
MSEAQSYQPTRHPKALATVVLMHGAALAALVLVKTDVMELIKDPPLVVVDVKQPDPPPPEPVEVKPQPQAPQQRSQPTEVPPLVNIPLDRGPVMETTPFPSPPPIPEARPGPVDIAPPPPPPPPPPPKRLEPARAKANLASYVSDSDYPAAAIRGEEEGTTRFRLAVNEGGRVSQCEVVGSSGSSALDAATCRLMKSRARFTPARDSSGNVTGDTVTSAIRWVLPDD